MVDRGRERERERESETGCMGIEGGRERVEGAWE